LSAGREKEKRRDEKSQKVGAIRKGKREMGALIGRREYLVYSRAGALTS